MSKNSLILVLQNKQENSTIDMAKVNIKSEKLTPFGGIFSWLTVKGSRLGLRVNVTSVTLQYYSFEKTFFFLRYKRYVTILQF